MYLKKIVAHGFKSFADKINIDFNDGISGIVGPNGSGKSNVVDAVRWVLGEQSVKSLRGDGSMTDVIFSGSKSRNAANSASVTLIFDNSDKYINLDFNEISIKRRVYRDGTNEYYLNGERCRLKDIIDILLDSGIGKESFNIISQGKIEEIIATKPQERRVIFEEAAGVLKYKRRKEEALRKLDRTHDNMDRVNDIIRELEVQVEPLREQKEKAVKYIAYKDELKDIEVALIANDITNINYDYQDKKKRIEVLEKELISINTSNTTQQAEIEKYKLELNNFDSEIAKLQQQILTKTSVVEQINSRKAIILERQKYQVADIKKHNNLISLKETELKLNNDLINDENKLNRLKKEYQTEFAKYKEQENVIDAQKNKKKEVEINLFHAIRQKDSNNLKIDNLKQLIEDNNNLPYTVKQVLNNPKLTGIHGVIGKVIEVPETYSIAISTSLGMASSNIIVENEMAAKNAINYLKNNNLGRATFFPLNLIKPKYVDNETINLIKQEIGFVGVASSLVKVIEKFDNIIKNQLGNVLVVDTIDHANYIAKIINHRYKIVTLDGELLHVGGSVTGGRSTVKRNIINDKYELEHLLKDNEHLIGRIKNLENMINEIDYNLKAEEDKLYLINREMINLNENITVLSSSINGRKQELNNIKNEISDINRLLDNSLSEEEQNVIEAFYQEEQNLNNLKTALQETTNLRTNLNDELEKFEYSLKKDNSAFIAKSKELKELEIDVNRSDVKLDNLLNTLGETYNMTYEKAISLYKLEIDSKEATNRVSNLKRKINDLGIVNLAAPEEYDRISERYEFLIGQRDDLAKAEVTLLDIIKEMDKVMEKEFISTFEIIRKNFAITFKELFKGGNADLKLTDANNILETGVEIVASPPGKKLSSISLLSGGEKTFTAISLLFAILKSRPVPFCILDEVEAALDEANVDSFGQYLKMMKEKTQFIIITHKKRTMEYVDLLYGITMQESGVSKLVSVRLEDIK
ncbi:MAG: chromosome segregation protein SMC [Bacilli bacterium]